MADGAGDGTQERLTQVERRVERGEESRSDLWKAVSALEKETAVISTEIKGIVEDIGEIRGDTKATRKWVEEQIQAKEEETVRKEELTRGQKVAAYGAAALVIAAIISALAQVISSGAL